MLAAEYCIAGLYGAGLDTRWRDLETRQMKLKQSKGAQHGVVSAKVCCSDKRNGRGGASYTKEGRWSGVRGLS
jgi:hypothetical protein